jgi:hypothetical protein
MPDAYDEFLYWERTHEALEDDTAEPTEQDEIPF